MSSVSANLVGGPLAAFWAALNQYSAAMGPCLAVFEACWDIVVSLVACTGLRSSGRRSVLFNKGAWFGRPRSAWEQRLGMR
eukprot:7684392-Pyramimonas_sp.AAC.1